MNTSPPPNNNFLQRGKRRHRPEHDEGQRTRFQRDRDAILYTTAFRRLAGVTQVVTPSEGHIYHNRLTHTLEVAQIALRLAEYLLSSPDDKKDGKEYPARIEAYGGLDASV